jgi:hypothetical protein
MSLTGSRFSSESAVSPSSMGFEDEADQTNGRPCREMIGRSKRTHDLTSSIVPRGTSFHRRRRKRNQMVHKRSVMSALPKRTLPQTGQWPKARATTDTLFS